MSRLSVPAASERSSSQHGTPAQRRILWHVIPDDDDRGPSKTFPPCRDGDELLARVNDETVEVTVSRRHGVAFVGADGEAVEPDAIAERPRPPASRSGKRKAPFLNVQLPATEAEQERFKAAAAEEGQALSRWLLEAARAYEIMGKRDAGELTDEDWREVVA